MITFEQLIERTYSYLETTLERGVELAPPPEFIAEILQEVGISAVIRKAEFSNQPKQLIVQEVFIEGRKWQFGSTEDQPFQYRRCLGVGLNGWKARTSKGKSTILKVLQWAITGVKPKLKPDIESWIKRVAVQINLVGEGVFTVAFYIEPASPQINVHGGIYKNELDKVLSGQEDIDLVSYFSGLADMASKVDGFFRLQMGLASEDEIFRQKYTETGSESISWNTYSQSMFIADSYIDYLFPNSRVGRSAHEETMGIHLGLNLTKSISYIKDEVKLSQKTYDDERKKVKVAQDEVSRKLKQFRDELLNTEDQIARLRKGESVRVNPDYADSIRRDRAEARRRLYDLETLEDVILAEQNEYKKQLIQAERTIKHLEESIDFGLFLSGIEVSRCPHCENEISESRFENELTTHHCGLCNSELTKLSQDSKIEQQTALLEEEKENLKKWRADLKRLGKNLYPIREQIKGAKVNLEKTETEYRSIAQQELESVTSKIQELLEYQGYLRGRLDELQEQTIEFQEEKVGELKKRRDILKAALDQLQMILQRDNSIVIQELTSSTLEYARLFGVPNLEAIELDNEFSMTIKQGGEEEGFRETEVSEALRIKIAFHLALLSLRYKDQGQGRHPGLLVIDAPGSGEMDDYYLGEMLKNLASIQEKLGDQVQILIASTRDEIVELGKNDPKRIEVREGDDPIF